MGKHSRGRIGVRHLLGVASSDLDLGTWTTPEAEPVEDVSGDAFAVPATAEPPLIAAPHWGRRVVYDNDGRELGVITGDHVIGYTVMCWDAESWFLDLDTAEAAVLAEARSRAPGRYPQAC